MTKKKHKLQITTQKKDISNSQFERAYVVAKKVLRHFDPETNLLDSFSKKQKHTLLKTIFDIPSIKPEKERTIPRQYVENIRRDTLQYMKTEYFGNPENKLTYMEVATYGLGFLMSLIAMGNEGFFKGLPQEESVQQFIEKVDLQELLKSGFEKLLLEIEYLTKSYSQVNFRLYGFIYEWERGTGKIRGTISMQMKIKLTVHNCESKIFNYHNIERRAFQLILPDRGLFKPSWSIIRTNRIFPNAKENQYLNIYIQAHALHRLKERMDIFEPTTRNYLIQYTFQRGQLVVSTEKQKFLACALTTCVLGYFTFFIQGFDIVINTFIPIVSEATPEGEKLHKLLRLSKEDIVYLGMDKLSFFTKIDFEQIPVLKQALIDADIWKTKIELDGMLDKDSLEAGETPIDMQKTLFVKHFFDKLQQHNTETENE